MHTRSTPADRPVALKTILRKMVTHKKTDLPRFVLSGKASKRLREIHKLTNIPMETLADAAIDAIHAAMANRPTPRQIKDAKLRAWLNSPEAETGQRGLPE